MADQNKGKSVPSNANFAATLSAALENIKQSQLVIKTIIDSTVFIDNLKLDTLKERSKKFSELSNMLKPILDNMKSVLDVMNLAGEKFGIKAMIKFQLFLNHYEIILSDLTSMMMRIPIDDIVAKNAEVSQTLAESVKTLLESLDIVNKMDFKTIFKLRLKIKLLNKVMNVLFNWIGELALRLKATVGIEKKTENLGRSIANIFRILGMIDTFGLLQGIIIRLKLGQIIQTFDAIVAWMSQFGPGGKYEQFVNTDVDLKKQIKLIVQLLKIFILINKLPKVNDKTIKAANHSVENLAEFMETIQEKLDQLQINPSIIKNLANVKKILVVLKSIFLDVILLAIGAPLLLLAVPVAIIAVFLLLSFVRVVGWLASKVTPKVTKEILLSILRIGKIIQSLVIMMLAVMVIAVMTPIFIVSLLVGGLGIIALLLFIILLSKMLKFVDNVAKRIVLSVIRITLIMLLMCASMLIIAGTFWLLSFMVSRVTDHFGEILAFLALIAVFAVGFAALAMVTPYVMAGMTGIIAVTIAIAGLLLISIMLICIPKIAEHIDEGKVLSALDKIFDIAFVVINSLFEPRKVNKNSDNTDPNAESVIEYGAQGPLATLLRALISMVVLIMVFVAVTMILLIALMLRGLQELNLDKGAILDKVSIVFDTAYVVINALFDSDGQKDSEGESEPWYESVLNWFAGTFKSLAMIIQAVLAIAFLALILVSVALINLIALGLRGLQEIGLDKGKIDNNLSIVFSAAYAVIDSIFGPKDEEESEESKKGWMESMLDWFGSIFQPIATLVKAIMAVGFLALILVSVGMIMLIAKSLTYIQDVQLNKGLILSKVGTIIDTGYKVINKVQETKETNKPKGDRGWLKGALDWMGLGTIVDALQAIGDVGVMVACVGLLESLAENLVKINDLPDISNVQRKTDVIIAAGDNLLTKLAKSGEDFDEDDYKDKVDILGKVINHLVRFNNINPSNLTTATENTIKFLDRVNTIDLEKLRTTEKLFEKMAEFSKSINGNFDGLAESLNDKIAPLLEELKGLLEEIPQKSEETLKKLANAQLESNTGNLSDSSKKFLAGDDTNAQKKLERNVKEKRKNEEKTYTGMQDIMDILLGQAGYKGVKISR